MSDVTIDGRLLPYAFARDFALLAHRDGAPGSTVEVWVSEATTPTAIAEVSRRFGRVKLKSMPREALEAAIAKAYAGSGGDAAQVIDEYESDLDLARLMMDMPAVEDLLESADDAPVIRMINALLTQALREEASDIHIEPYEQTSVVRFRVDGALRDIVRPKKGIHASLVSRIKIMASLDIAEKRLRQDPDVIMIGEIRDLETAQIAVQASLTGHLVLATLHTNDSAAAVTRLLDMGIEPFLLSSSLLGAVAQRLVRKLCENCKTNDGQQWHAVGC